MAAFDKLRNTKNHTLRQIALSLTREPKAHRVFMGCSDNKIYATDPTAATLALREIGSHDSYVTGVALSGNTLVSGSYDRTLAWWDVTQARRIRSVDAHGKWVRSVVASPDGRIIASTADDMVCKLWETSSGKLLRELKGHQERTPTNFPSMLYTCAFSNDGTRLATGDKVGHIVIWEVSSGKQLKTMEAPGMYTWDGRQRIHSIGGIRSLAFSPDGKQLAVGGIGHIGNVDHLDGPARVEIFDVSSGKSVQLFDKTRFKGLVNRLVFHPSGSWLLGAGGSGTGFFFFMDLQQKKVLKEETGRFHIHGFAVDEKSETIYAAGHNGLAMWELPN